MTPMAARLLVEPATIADFCARNRIRWLALYGSVLRDDFDDESDVDVLFEMEPGVRLGLDRWRIQADLADLLGREVDLAFPDELSKYIRARVLGEAETIYVRR
jgi:predicted nucleotidyltransferase